MYLSSQSFRHVIGSRFCVYRYIVAFQTSREIVVQRQLTFGFTIFVLVEYQRYVVPVVGIVFMFHRFGSIGRSIYGSRHTVVFGHTEAQGFVARAMTEDNRILGFGHVNPCLYCDVLATEAALQFAAERVASVGFYGYGMCRLRTVSDTGYFKVVFAQITGGNRFVECNLDIIVDGQDTVGRLRSSEQAWAVHVFHPRTDFGEILHFRIVDVTYRYGAKVVRLVGHVVQEPLVADGSAVFGLNHLGVQSGFDSLVIVFLIVEVVHQRHPVFVRSTARLIHQADALEVVVIHIKVCDFHIHVMYRLVVFILFGRQLGVVCPVVARCLHCHVRTSWSEVYAESYGVGHSREVGCRVALAL